MGYVRDDTASAPDFTKLERAKAEAAERQRTEAAERLRTARWLWRDNLPISGTIAETYLRECRGYRGPLPSTLRFLPARGEHGPAMIAAFGLPGEGERILAGSIVEKFTRRANGELEPLTEGSTKPVAEIRRHAGICRVELFEASCREAGESRTGWKPHSMRLAMPSWHGR